MPELAVLGPPPSTAARLDVACWAMAGRLADLVQRRDPGAAALLRGRAGDSGHPAPDGSALGLPSGGGDPIDLLVAGLGLRAAEVDLLVLAGLAEQHEDLAEALARLHPEGRPCATAGLAGMLADAGSIAGLDARGGARDLLLEGALARCGALLLDDGQPFWLRSLVPGDRLWDALLGADAWPSALSPIPLARLGGEDPLMAGPQADAAVRAIGEGRAVTVLVAAERPAAAAPRAAWLTWAAGLPAVALQAPRLDGPAACLAALHALVRGGVPVVAADQLTPRPGALDEVPGPLVVVTPEGEAVPASARPLVVIPPAPAAPALRRAAWRAVAPEIDPPGDLADLEPAEVASAAADARRVERLSGAPPGPAWLAAAVAGRRGHTRPPGLLRVHPAARWDDLVVGEEVGAILRDVVARATHRDTVLGRWGLLAGRSGRRGIALLLAGPPGTGKTLAAEVVAAALDRDLLVVDLARLLSRWLGGTEKHLAEAFDAAERGDAVLFFDEADGLFGRRTDADDARDRYANMQSAYLLGRLERFDGVAILATNLRHHLDAAFVRRLDAIARFEPPDAAARAAIWRAHLPATAPLDPDVDLDLLAVRYEVTGALIRNAVLSAAYLAAAEDAAIAMRHLLAALAREHRKADLPFPGPPPGHPSHPT